MKPELEKQLVEQWPGWFRTDGDIRQTLMPLGFQCGGGWFSLIWKLCEDLDPLVAQFEAQTGGRFEVLEVKEKFGQLRMYTNHRTSATSKRMGIAEAESLRTCELCGEAGRLRTGDRIQTLCDRCYESSR